MAKTTYQSYLSSKELYEKYKMKVLTKITQIDYTKKIRMILGLYIKLASNSNYIEDIN